MKKWLLLFFVLCSLNAYASSTGVILQDGTGNNVGSASNPLKVTCLSGCGGGDLVSDTSPQLGGDLDLNGHVITGMVIGTNIQAYDADLTTWAGITPGSGVDTFLATPSSANLASALTGETGSGAAVFATSPTLVTPDLGVATSTSVAVQTEAYDATGWDADLTVPTKDAVRDKIEAIVAGNTAWDDIADPDADTTIALTGYETTLTSTLDAANKSVLKISNTDADIANNTTLLTLQYLDNGDADGVFMKLIDDSAGTPTTVWQVGANGATTISGGSTGQFDLGSAGVRMTDDGDGAITLLGLGDGFDEDLTINLDDTSNTAALSSSTGVNKFLLNNFENIKISTTVTTAYPSFNLQNSAAETAFFYLDSGDEADPGAYLGSASAIYFSFLTSDAERLRVQADGGINMFDLAVATNDNAVCIDATTEEIENAGNTTCATSSARFKKDIKDYTGGLNDLMKIKIHSYKYKEGYDNPVRDKAGELVGPIAEEVNEVDARLVEYDSEGLPRTFNQFGLTSVAIKAIQDLKHEVDFYRWFTFLLIGGMRIVLWRRK